MGMETKITEQPHSILVKVSGEFSLDEAKISFLDLVDSIRKLRKGNVLFDGRELTGEPRLLERFYYGHFVADAVRELVDRGWSGPDLRFAYVLKQPVLHEHRLGETTAASRGMNIRVFEDINEAIVWLLPEMPVTDTTSGTSQKVLKLKPEI